MIPGLYGSVAPGWTGVPPGVTWPGLGVSALTGIESASIPGQLPVASQLSIGGSALPRLITSQPSGPAADIQFVGGITS